MSVTSTSHNTARKVRSKPLMGILANLKLIADNSPGLSTLVTPSQQIVTALHHYATSSASGEENKSAIANDFKELGIQVADKLKTLYQSNKACFQGLLRRVETFTEKLKALLMPKKSLISDTASEETIAKIVQYSKIHQEQIVKMTSDTPLVSFQAKAASGKTNNTVDIKEPLKLFEYIDLANQRNNLIGRDGDCKIKGLIQLAYCVKRHSETNGQFVATNNGVAEVLNLRPRSLTKEASLWNDAVSKVKQQSAISDYSDLLAKEAIQNRETVIQTYNQGHKGHKGQQIDTLQDPNKLMQYLILTKKMQAIKLSIENEPEAAEQSANYKSLDIVMQWYLQLGADHPIISLQDYAKQKFQIKEKNDLANIKRIKSIWNRGKLTENSAA